MMAYIYDEELQRMVYRYVEDTCNLSQLVDELPSKEAKEWMVERIEMLNSREYEQIVKDLLELATIKYGE